MIGDISLDARLTFLKLGTPPLQAFALGDLNVKLSTAGKDCIVSTVNATLVDQVLDLGLGIGSSVYGYVVLKNMYPALITTPGAPTVATTGGGTTRYDYKIVATQADGSYTQASPAGSVTNGPATLDSSHANRIDWSPVDDAVGGYDVYRVVGGGALGTGWIGGPYTTPPFSLFDIGLAGNGVQPPATSPFDYRIQFGPTNASYPILLKGNDVQVFRWNFATSAAIHFKALVNISPFAYMIVEE